MRRLVATDRERGQTIVVFVVFLIVLLCFVGVVVDGGMYYVERRDMQGTADAAALAAVRELPMSTGQATARAKDYVDSRNGDADGTLESITFDDSARMVTVVVGKTGTQNFGGVMGLSAPHITATATARVQMVGAMPGMLPIAFMKDNFTIGENEEIKWDDPGNGNRGPIAPQMQPSCGIASGGNDFGDLIRGEDNGGINACGTEVGGLLPTETGNMTGPTKKGFGDRLDGNTQSFDDIFSLDATSGRYVIDEPDSPRIGIVPVIENTDGSSEWPNGKKDVRIVSYMLVYIGDRDTAGYPATDGKSVWVTPIQALLPQDFGVTEFMDYDDGSSAPVVYRLTA